MARLYGTVTVPKFDAVGYTKAVKESIEIQFRKAAAKFVRAAIAGVPVQTGMAKGSFLNIGRFLRVAIPISPSKRNQWYYPPGGGGRIPKTPQQGAALSTQPADAFKWNGNRLSFEFETGVFHYTLNDLIGIHGPPWGTFAAGRDAFIAEMSLGLRTRLPNIGSFITLTSITYGRGRVIRSTPIRLRKQETVR